MRKLPVKQSIHIGLGIGVGDQDNESRSRQQLNCVTQRELDAVRGGRLRHHGLNLEQRRGLGRALVGALASPLDPERKGRILDDIRRGKSFGGEGSALIQIKQPKLLSLRHRLFGDKGEKGHLSSEEWKYRLYENYHTARQAMMQ